MTTTLTHLSPEAFETMRMAMVASQLRTNSVSDPRVVAAMAGVPRERFVPEDQRELAYSDRKVPLGRGRDLNVPMATGRLLTESQFQPGDRVLLVGAASGYTAAVLAELVAHVVAVESDPALVAMARGALGSDDRVTLVEGDLRAGHPEGAPYDALLIDGAIEELPETLVAQVRTGGRIATGLIDGNVVRLASGRRSAGGHGLIAFADMDCAPLPGFERPRSFTF